MFEYLYTSLMYEYPLAYYVYCYGMVRYGTVRYARVTWQFSAKSAHARVHPRADLAT